jgi:hypothetical protein
MLWVHVLGIVNFMLVLIRDRGAIYMLLCLHDINIFSSTIYCRIYQKVLSFEQLPLLVIV